MVGQSRGGVSNPIPERWSVIPSPFPGMDPFIEGRMWRDFHHELLSVIRELIAPRLVPRYVTRIEERVYVEYTPEAPDGALDHPRHHPGGGGKRGCARRALCSDRHRG